MPCYIDSSFILSLLLEQNIDENEISIWHNNAPLLSSFLLEIECLVTLRRVYKHNESILPKHWLKTKENQFKELIKEITIKNIDRSILDVIDLHRELSDCRTLDAIHVGTAILFSEHSTEPIFMCSYDKRVRTISKQLGMPLLPETVQEI